MWGFGVIIVNSYVAYIVANVLIWKRKRKNLLTHYQYRKSCALALISRTQSEEDDHTRCSEATGETNSSSSIGRPRKVRRVTFVETRSSSHRAPEKACRVNDKTLDPVHGRLRCRLNSKIPHLPHDNVKKTRSKALRCALHRWSDRNAQVKQDVMVCSTCGVALCIWCYKNSTQNQMLNNCGST